MGADHQAIAAGQRALRDRHGQRGWPPSRRQRTDTWRNRTLPGRPSSGDRLLPADRGVPRRGHDATSASAKYTARRVLPCLAYLVSCRAWGHSPRVGAPGKKGSGLPRRLVTPQPHVGLRGPRSAGPPPRRPAAGPPPARTGLASVGQRHPGLVTMDRCGPGRMPIR